MSEASDAVRRADPADAAAAPRNRFLVYATCGSIVLLLGIYFPILRIMVEHWAAVEDYQHGFLIAPLALYFAYGRRHSKLSMERDKAELKS